MKPIAPSIKQPVFAALAVVATCFMITLAVRGSEATNSGWTVTRPATVLDTKHTDSPRIRIAINHVLEQSQTPLLQAPAQQRAVDEVAEKTPANEAPIVFGTYGASTDGWRPAHLPTNLPRTAPAPEQETGTEPSSSLRFRSASSSSSRTNAPTPAEAKSEPAPVATATPVEQPATEAEATVTDTQPEASRSEPVVESSAAARDEQSPVAKKPPAPPLPPLSQNMKNLRAKVRRVIKSYYTRPLNSRDNDPWELMHGMLAYGVHSKIRQGSPQGSTITLVGWLCYNKPSKGMTLLYLTPENDLRAKQGVGLQGHMGQFLAMLAQCQVSPDYPIRVRNQEFAINDLIEAEKETCYPKSELTFKLIALMHYLDSDASWVNDQGASWDIPRLIREELAQPIRGAACGGTHRLSGLSLAARTRVRRGEPLDGEYLRAAQFVEKYQNYAFQLQNRDGSLSTEWFRGRGDENDTDRRVKTTGHILEWLCYSLDDKEVRSARTFRAANYLTSLLANNYNHEWEVGPLSHAIHALRLYDERVFKPYDGQDEVAKKAVRKTAQRSSPSSSRTSSNRY
jgi:hypothetical protein